MRIGIISRTDKEEAIELDDTIIKYLFENNIEVELDSQLTKKLPQYSENSVDITKMNIQKGENFSPHHTHR